MSMLQAYAQARELRAVRHPTTYRAELHATARRVREALGRDDLAALDGVDARPQGRRLVRYGLDAHHLARVPVAWRRDTLEFLTSELARDLASAIVRQEAVGHSAVRMAPQAA